MSISSHPSKRATSTPKDVTLVERLVERNKGTAGIDKMTVNELRSYLRKQWPRIKEALLAGKYEPKPVKEVAIPKADGGTVRSAFNRRGPWWNSGASHMNEAFPKNFFDRNGLVSMLDELYRFRHVNFGNRLDT